MPRFVNQGTGIPNVDKQLDRLNHILEPIENSDWLHGVIIYGQKIKANTQTQIEHGLGTTPRSWQVCGLRNAAVIWQVADANERYLNLQASHDCQFDIRIW